MKRSSSELIPKSELMRCVERAESFIDALHLPTYKVGKRDYYKECDYWIAIESIKPELKTWASSKSKAPRSTSLRSRSKVIDIEAQRALRKKRMQKSTTQTNEERYV